MSTRKLCICIFFCFTSVCFANELLQDQNGEQANGEKEVQVQPAVKDQDISKRLTNILNETGWFSDVHIEVREGIVFLYGVGNTAEHVEWAGKLAKRTEDVIAVVNNISVKEPTIWDSIPSWSYLQNAVIRGINKVPFVLFIAFLFVATWYASKGVIVLVRRLLKGRVKSTLLKDTIARLSAIPFILLGLFFVLQVMGLSRLALTVIGGTGIAGLVAGFAFKDIAENFLASIVVSVHHPFSMNDLIQVEEHMGYVQSVNSRSTVLLTQEGNFVQIPNATIYKEIIINYSANPITRDEFIIGIGYEDSIKEAQSVVMSVIEQHPAVSKDSEPQVVVEELGAATVNIKVLYWFDISECSRVKVRSSLMRQVKNALEKAGISMPDEAREVVFPKGVPVQMEANAAEKTQIPREKNPDESKIENDFKSEAETVEKQGKRAKQPEGTENFLK